jgi:hypothetical protein
VAGRAFVIVQSLAALSLLLGVNAIPDGTGISCLSGCGGICGVSIRQEQTCGYCDQRHNGRDISGPHEHIGHDFIAPVSQSNETKIYHGDAETRRKAFGIKKRKETPNPKTEKSRKCSDNQINNRHKTRGTETASEQMGLA